MNKEEIRETLKEILPLVKEILEMEEMKELINLYIQTALENKVLEEYNNKAIDRLATAIVKAQK